MLASASFPSRTVTLRPVAGKKFTVTVALALLGVPCEFCAL